MLTMLMTFVTVPHFLSELELMMSLLLFCIMYRYTTVFMCAFLRSFDVSWPAHFLDVSPDHGVIQPW